MHTSAGMAFTNTPAIIMAGSNPISISWLDLDLLAALIMAGADKTAQNGHKKGMQELLRAGSN